MRNRLIAVILCVWFPAVVVADDEQILAMLTEMNARLDRMEADIALLKTQISLTERLAKPEQTDVPLGEVIEPPQQQQAPQPAPGRIMALKHSEAMLLEYPAEAIRYDGPDSLENHITSFHGSSINIIGMAREMMDKLHASIHEQERQEGRSKLVRVPPPMVTYSQPVSTGK